MKLNIDTTRLPCYTLRYTLRFIFANKKLELLYTSGTGAAKYPPEVVDAFFDKMAVIRAARDENDLRASKASTSRSCWASVASAASARSA